MLGNFLFVQGLWMYGIVFQITLLMLLLLMFKAHLDKFWEHQQVVFNFKAELTGTGNRSEYIYNL